MGGAWGVMSQFGGFFFAVYYYLENDSWGRTLALNGYHSAMGILLPCVELQLSPTPEKQIFVRKKRPQERIKFRTPTTIPERTHALDPSAMATL